MNMTTSQIVAMTDLLLSRGVDSPVPDTPEGRKQALAEFLNDVLNEPAPRTVPNPNNSTVPTVVMDENQKALIEEIGRKIALKRLSNSDPSGVVTRALDPCSAAFANGLAGITVGALVGGPVGAGAGFVLGVVDLAVSC